MEKIRTSSSRALSPKHYEVEGNFPLSFKTFILTPQPLIFGPRTQQVSFSIVAVTCGCCGSTNQIPWMVWNMHSWPAPKSIITVLPGNCTWLKDDASFKLTPIQAVPKDSLHLMPGIQRSRPLATSSDIPKWPSQLHSSLGDWLMLLLHLYVSPFGFCSILVLLLCHSVVEMMLR